MTLEEELPFYYQAKGPLIVTKNDVAAFKKDNPELSDLVDQYKYKSRKLDFDFFTSFCYWIIGQQLSVKAAESITKRFIDLVNPLTPVNLLKTVHEDLRKCGLSNSKAEYIKNIAQFVIDNSEHNKFQSPHKFTSEELREYFTQIRGVGPWTVNMYLIFNLGKKDVYATGDLVVRKGIQKMYKLKEVPTERFCKNNYNWGPYATVGTLLAWNIIGD